MKSRGLRNGSVMTWGSLRMLPMNRPTSSLPEGHPVDSSTTPLRPAGPAPAALMGSFPLMFDQIVFECTGFFASRSR
jgi:hypothetical protein